jgi:hypothetical protein
MTVRWLHVPAALIHAHMPNANAQWQEVPSGTAIPRGLEVKMDMQTGKVIARRE